MRLAGGSGIAGGRRRRGGIGAGAQGIGAVLGLGAGGGDLLGGVGLGGGVGRGRAGGNGGQIRRGGAGVGGGLLAAVGGELAVGRGVVVAAEQAGGIEIGHGLATGGADRQRQRQRRHSPKDARKSWSCPNCPCSQRSNTGSPASRDSRACANPALPLYRDQAPSRQRRAQAKSRE